MRDRHRTPRKGLEIEDTQKPLPPHLDERLSAMLRKLAAGRGIRHAVLAVGRPDGSPLWLGTTGSADDIGTPMTARTPYFLASVTKLYIATAILRLAERGLVSLNAPMADYLPDRLTAGLHVWKGIDRTDEITVRHLLAHASGLPEYLSLRPPGAPSLADLVSSGRDHAWGMEDIAALVREHGRPEFRPRPFDGRRRTIRYSDTNFQLLIAIVKSVTGKSLQGAFDELIFGPLNLRHTFLPGTPVAEAAAPPPAAVWFGDQRLDSLPDAMRSFNDLYGTAEDSLRFMSALISGEVFENPATAAQMRTDWNPFAFSLSLQPLGPGWPMEYGLGTIRYRLPRLLTPFQPMPETLGHTGVTGSWLFHIPELNLMTAGTVDQATAAAVPYRFVPRLLRLLKEA